MNRTPSPDFEPRVADWLEDDPDHAPAAVLATVVAAFPSIPQRRASRVPWRYPPMSRFALIGAAAATIVVVGIGGVMLASRPSGPDVGAGPIVSPAPSPSPTPGASPSPRADYSDVPGRLLVQHLGNALDGSEADPADGNYDRRRLYLMNPDGSGISELLPGQPASGKVHADVSPDGTKVVFQDPRAETTSRIYEANLDGTGLRLLTQCICGEGHPAYSPDGGKIAFTRWNGGTGRIGVRDLASGEITLYPETEGTWPEGGSGDSPEHASWSPDGSLIVYALIRRDAEGRLVSSQLLQLDVGTREVTDLGVPETLGAGEPRYSPDGTLILFASRSAETSLGEAQGDIYTVRPDGSGLRRLTGNGDGDGDCDNGTGASWTPDGRYIVYMCNWILLMESDGANKARWSQAGPDLSETATGYGYTTYWIPPAP